MLQAVCGGQGLLGHLWVLRGETRGNRGDTGVLERGLHRGGCTGDLLALLWGGRAVGALGMSHGVEGTPGSPMGGVGHLWGSGYGRALMGTSGETSL